MVRFSRPSEDMLWIAVFLHCRQYMEKKIVMRLFDKDRATHVGRIAGLKDVSQEWNWSSDAASATEWNNYCDSA